MGDKVLNYAWLEKLPFKQRGSEPIEILTPSMRECLIDQTSKKPSDDIDVVLWINSNRHDPSEIDELKGFLDSLNIELKYLQGIFVSLEEREHSFYTEIDEKAQYEHGSPTDLTWRQIDSLKLLLVKHTIEEHGYTESMFSDINIDNPYKGFERTAQGKALIGRKHETGYHENQVFATHKDSLPTLDSLYSATLTYAYWGKDLFHAMRNHIQARHKSLDGESSIAEYGEMAFKKIDKKQSHAYNEEPVPIVSEMGANLAEPERLDKGPNV